MTLRSRGLAAFLALGLGFPTGAFADPLVDAIPTPSDELIRISGREILRRALENLYGCDIAQQVDLYTKKNGKEVRRHSVTLMRKEISGKAHTLFDYTMNNELYGLRSLRIEREEGEYDRFLFLPEFQRVRRFGAAQRADLILGTNLHFEDLEVRTPATWGIVGRSMVEYEGERVHRLELEPVHELDYVRADMLVEPERFGIRRIRYFRAGQTEPHRILTAPREEMVPFPDRILPSHWVIEEPKIGVVTDVYFRRIRTHPEVNDLLFSARTLESNAALPAFQD